MKSLSSHEQCGTRLLRSWRSRRMDNPRESGGPRHGTCPARITASGLQRPGRQRRGRHRCTSLGSPSGAGATSPTTGTPTGQARKIKLSAVLDPTLEAEIVPLSEQEVVDMYNQYRAKFGDHPLPTLMCRGTSWPPSDKWWPWVHVHTRTFQYGGHSASDCCASSHSKPFTSTR